MYAIDHDAVFRCFFFCEHEMIARREQGLAWNAANVQASSTQFLVFLDKRRLQSELTSPDGGDITAGSGTDDNQIKFFHG